jgi:hypothetical protein
MSPGQYFNQHSFTIVAVASILILSVWLLRGGAQQKDYLAIGALAVGLGIAYLLFNPGGSTESDSKAVLAQIGAGTPVLLEFQSPY